jgi:hypothetical protein
MEPLAARARIGQLLKRCSASLYLRYQFSAPDRRLGAHLRKQRVDHVAVAIIFGPEVGFRRYLLDQAATYRRAADQVAAASS